MKRTQIQADLMGLANTIRAIRLRLDVSMTTFAKRMGVTQGQISRYEGAVAAPSYPVLGRLLSIAEGAEKKPILEHLVHSLKLPTGITEAEALAEAKAEDERNNAISDEIMGYIARVRSRPPNLAELVKLVAILHEREREVDPALPKLVRMWLEHPDTDPKMRQIFRDAAQYVEVLLKANVASVPEEKRRYRIILPVDLGDGVQRLAGEVVELTLAHAIRYANALRTVEEDGTMAEEKRLA
jgi:transcriptional regulator with XRE-family HTH domain